MSRKGQVLGPSVRDLHGLRTVNSYGLLSATFEAVLSPPHHMSSNNKHFFGDVSIKRAIHVNSVHHKAKDAELEGAIDASIANNVVACI